MEAQITLKATPTEFDDLRKALELALDSARAEERDSTLSAGTRSQARVRALRLGPLIDRLR